MHNAIGVILEGINMEKDIVDELFESDEASALTNSAAREIEKLREELKTMEKLYEMDCGHT